MAYLAPVSGVAAGHGASNVFGAPRKTSTPNLFRPHSGVDIQAPYGAPVVASANGIVAWVGYSQGYQGNVVVLNSDGTAMRYAMHMPANAIPVKFGDTIVAGQVLGEIGTLHSPHLHFEYITDPTLINQIKSNLEQGVNAPISTSFKKGVSDPLAEFGVPPGTTLVAGEPFADRSAQLAGMAAGLEQQAQQNEIASLLAGFGYALPGKQMGPFGDETVLTEGAKPTEGAAASIPGLEPYYGMVPTTQAPSVMAPVPRERPAPTLEPYYAMTETSQPVPTPPADIPNVGALLAASEGTKSQLATPQVNIAPETITSKLNTTVPPQVTTKALESLAKMQSQGVVAPQIAALATGLVTNNPSQVRKAATDIISAAATGQLSESAIVSGMKAALLNQAVAIATSVNSIANPGLVPSINPFGPNAGLNVMLQTGVEKAIGAYTSLAQGIIESAGKPIPNPNQTLVNYPFNFAGERTEDGKTPPAAIPGIVQTLGIGSDAKFPTVQAPAAPPTSSVMGAPPSSGASGVGWADAIAGLAPPQSPGYSGYVSPSMQLGVGSPPSGNMNPTALQARAPQSMQLGVGSPLNVGNLLTAGAAADVPTISGAPPPMGIGLQTALDAVKAIPPTAETPATYTPPGASITKTADDALAARAEGLAGLPVGFDDFGLGLMPDYTSLLGEQKTETETKKAAPPPAPVVQSAAPAPTYSQAVADAQKALKAAGYDPGPIDGIMGPQTQAAINAANAASKAAPAGPVAIGQPAAPAGWSVSPGGTAYNTQGGVTTYKTASGATISYNTATGQVSYGGSSGPGAGPASGVGAYSGSVAASSNPHSYSPAGSMASGTP